MESKAKNWDWVCCICRQKIGKNDPHNKVDSLFGHTWCIESFKELLGRTLERE